jgi:small conductance mechanosensitive channel
VLTAIKYALDKHGIDMPYNTQVILHHDQTEELDGVRGKQREGWPKAAS